jgi:hypothetical protein
VPTFIQRVFSQLTQPFQQMVRMVQSFFQALPQLPNALANLLTKGALMERMASQIMTFFFGSKKSEREEKEEKEKRFQADVQEENLFMLGTVEQSNGSAFGGGRQ